MSNRWGQPCLGFPISISSLTTLLRLLDGNAPTTTPFSKLISSISVLCLPLSRSQNFIKLFFFHGRAIALSSIASSFISNKSFNEAYASAGDLICQCHFMFNSIGLPLDSEKIYGTVLYSQVYCRLLRSWKLHTEPLVGFLYPWGLRILLLIIKRTFWLNSVVIFMIVLWYLRSGSEWSITSSDAMGRKDSLPIGDCSTNQWGFPHLLGFAWTWTRVPVDVLCFSYSI